MIVIIVTVIHSTGVASEWAIHSLRLYTRFQVGDLALERLVIDRLSSINEDYGIARTYRCTGQSYRYPFPQMGTDGKTSLGTDAVPVEHRYRYRKRHCGASRSLVQVQTYRISTVPVEYRYR